MIYLEKLTEITPLGGHRLALTFDDGFAAQLDLAPLLVDSDPGPFLAPLRDPELFQRVTLAHGGPQWPGDIDFSPATLRLWAEAGRVLSPEETDAALLAKLIVRKTSALLTREELAAVDHQIAYLYERVRGKEAAI